MMARKRKDLTIAEKVHLLDKVKNYKPRPSTRQLAAILGVSKTTLVNLLQKEEQLRIESQQFKAPIKRKRNGKNPEIEKALKTWFRIVVGRGVRITGPLLKEKAETFARELNYPEFKARDGWLSRWKVREGIKIKPTHGDKASTDVKLAKEWKSTEPPKLQDEYSPDDIYNADETGLYYNAMPDSSLVFRNETFIGSKKAMDHITVLCCANMSGNDKRKLLVIGKSAEPLCFKGISMSSLPVIYCSNKNAWMTEVIFSEWLLTWNEELQILKRKILLLIDSCSAHPHLDNLSNIRLKFLPPNTTLVIQPMDTGIIKSLKMAYRAKLVKFTLDTIEDMLLTSESSAREISAKLTLAQAISFLADSWRVIKSTTIQKCFKRCGFKLLNVNTDSPENDLDMSFMHKVVNSEAFLGIDDHLQCYDENEPDLVKQIVENIEQDRNDKVNDNDKEDLMQETPVEMVGIEDMDNTSQNSLNETNLLYKNDGLENQDSFGIENRTLSLRESGVDIVSEARHALQFAQSLVTNEEGSKEAAFGRFVASELKQIKEASVYKKTKWKIQVALNEALQEQGKIDVS